MWNFCGPWLTMCLVLLAVAWSLMAGSMQSPLRGLSALREGRTKSLCVPWYTIATPTDLKACIVGWCGFFFFQSLICECKNSSAFPPEKFHHLEREKWCLFYCLKPPLVLLPFASGKLEHIKIAEGRAEHFQGIALGLKQTSGQHGRLLPSVNVRKTKCLQHS